MAILIEQYSPEVLEPVLTILADAFVTSPLPVSAFGPNQLDQNRGFFRIGLRHMFVGTAYVASVNGEICGYAHFNASPYCLPPPEEIPRAMANLLTPLGQAKARVMQWFSRWCHLDPDEPHIHLGPIGVAPAFQHQGVGTALMQRYLDHLRRDNLSGYLETDKPENVKFYERFAFEVTHEEEVIGTPTWYMWRRKESS
jgi:GNAT superfamily N-acetyltransferase